VVTQQQFRGAVAEDDAKLALGQPPVERNENRAEQRAGKESVEIFRRVGRKNRDTVALADAVALVEQGSEREGAGVKHAVFVALVRRNVPQPPLVRHQLLAWRQPLANAGERCCRHGSIPPQRSAVAPQVKPSPALASTTRSPHATDPAHWPILAPTPDRA